jgi:hypothetical protein
MATALAIGSLALAAVGTGVTVYGQMQAADAQQKQANYQASIATRNAQLAQQAADQARQDGETKAAQSALAGKQLIARQRVAFAANGVDANAGSAADIQADTAEGNKLDQLTILNNAERQAIGFQNLGANFNGQAGLDTLAGSNAQSAGTSGAFGSLLSGGGAVADKWYKFNQQFPGGSGDPTLNASMVGNYGGDFSAQ